MFYEGGNRVIEGSTDMWVTGQFNRFKPTYVSLTTGMDLNAIHLSSENLNRLAVESRFRQGKLGMLRSLVDT